MRILVDNIEADDVSVEWVYVQRQYQLDIGEDLTLYLSTAAAERLRDALVDELGPKDEE